MFKLFGIPINKWKLILILGDLLAYTLAVVVAVALNPKMERNLLESLLAGNVSFALVAFPYFLVLYIADLYDYQQDFRYWVNTARVIGASLIGALIVIVLFYFPLGVFVGRTWLVLQAGIFTLLLVGWRWLFCAFALPQRLQRHILIVGAGQAGQRLVQALQNRPRSGFAALGFIDDDPEKVGAEVEGLPVLGNSSQLPELTESLHIKLVVVAITYEKSPELIKSLTRISWNGCQVFDMPGFYEFLTGKIPVEHVSDLWLFLNSLQRKSLYYQHLKRFLDVGLTLVILLVLWPVFLLVALAIKLDSRGPVFFRQERLGLNGKPFHILKFRTMVKDAERLGPQFASPHDPRITRAGSILRKLRLDELPQLFNILNGDMSLVGPRPERDIFIQEFQELVPDMRPGRRAEDAGGELVCCGYKERIPYYSYRLMVKPGITGWAQVMYFYASSLEQTEEKLMYDLYYIKNIGFFLDMAILLKSIRIILFGRGT